MFNVITNVKKAVDTLIISSRSLDIPVVITKKHRHKITNGYINGILYTSGYIIHAEKTDPINSNHVDVHFAINVDMLGSVSGRINATKSLPIIESIESLFSQFTSINKTKALPVNYSSDLFSKTNISSITVPNISSSSSSLSPISVISQIIRLQENKKFKQKNDKVANPIDVSLDLEMREIIQWRSKNILSQIRQLHLNQQIFIQNINLNHTFEKAFSTITSKEVTNNGLDISYPSLDQKAFSEQKLSRPLIESVYEEQGVIVYEHLDSDRTLGLLSAFCDLKVHFILSSRNISNSCIFRYP
jgi:hypothetical protein